MAEKRGGPDGPTRHPPPPLKQRRKDKEKEPAPYKVWVEKYAPEDITPEEAGKRYQEYCQDWWRRHREEWFERHKDDEDVRELHDPRRLEHHLLPLSENVADLARRAAKSFFERNPLEQADETGLEEPLVGPIDDLVTQLDGERQIEAENSGTKLPQASPLRLDYLWEVHGVDARGHRELQLKELRDFLPDPSRPRKKGESESAQEDAEWVKRRVQDGGWVEVFLGRRRAEKAVEDFIESCIKRESDSKFGCQQCSKYFKGPEFVRKHVRNKHPRLVEDALERAQDETFRRNFLRKQEEDDKHRHSRDDRSNDGQQQMQSVMVVPASFQSQYRDLDARYSERPRLDYGDL